MKHPHLSPDDIYELVSIAHRETAHPRNLIKKRIIDRMNAIERAAPPLFSDNMNAVYREHKSRAGGGEAVLTGSDPPQFSRTLIGVFTSPMRHDLSISVVRCP